MDLESEDQIAGSALAAHPVGTLVVDLSGRVLYSNPAAQKAFGLGPKAGGATPQDISGWQPTRTSLHDLLSSASASSNWVPAVFSREGKTLHARMRGIRGPASATARVLITAVPDTTTPFLIHSQQVRDLNTQLANYQKIAGELKRSVEFSKVLERELVHRVKNNLAIISALLNQQARSAKDQDVESALKSAASRIRSIAVVHDILDTTRQTEAVDLKELVEDLIGGIRNALCPKHIEIVFEASALKIHLDIALPLALLINELVTNAIRHAFVDRDSGRIHVECSFGESIIDVRVADNGIGFPVDNDRRPMIVIALAEQLGGTVECRPEDGTEWILTIPFVRDGATARLV